MKFLMSTQKRKFGEQSSSANSHSGSSSFPSESSHVVESWSQTEQYKLRGRHYWTIVDFMRRAASTEVGNSLCSPVFSIPIAEDGEASPQNPPKTSPDSGDGSSLTFQLEVFPNGEEGEDNSDFVAVFLTSRKMEELEVTYDFSVQKADGTTWGKIGNTCKKFSPDQNSWGYGKAFSKARLIERMNELLPNGKLTIICNLEIYYDDRHTQGKRPRIEFNISRTPSLQEDLSTAFCRSELSDVTLKCGSASFSCHRVILASRSDVFAAMFSHRNTKEARTNIVKIDDIEEDTLGALLHFVYTDKVKDLPSLASSLLSASDKYNIRRLKSLCERHIAESVDASNAANVLILAHLHEAEMLKAAALDCICENMKAVSETSGWNLITESHPSLMSKVLVAMTSKLRT
eukprot:TRINITY_DN21755_c0_g1_i1.p1 TRINITY_DN21755_c0_g1~~TRINITY_DN21755_c0_g1_i1.p1  ORF type:complete len:403 (-),score=125.20 TRINITY_DN21755_c0_g1_i1:181-1389(-)